MAMFFNIILLIILIILVVACVKIWVRIYSLKKQKGPKQDIKENESSIDHPNNL
jgi:sensor domain CHASE-containing protein